MGFKLPKIELPKISVPPAITNLGNTLTNTASNAYQNLAQGASSAYQNLAQGASTAYQTLATGATNLYNNITNTFSNLVSGNGLIIAGIDVGQKVKEWAEGVFPVLGDLKGQVYSRIPVLGQVENFFSQGADQLLAMVKDVPGWLTQHIATPVSNFIGDHLLEPAKEHIIEPITRVGQQVGNYFDKALKWADGAKVQVQQAFDNLANFNPFEAGYNLFKKVAGGIYNVGKKFGGFVVNSTKNLVEAEIRKKPRGAWVLDNAIYFLPVGALIAGTTAAAYTTPIMNLAKVGVKTSKKVFSGLSSFGKTKRPMIGGI